jgi:hypothetical protein
MSRKPDTVAPVLHFAAAMADVRVDDEVQLRKGHPCGSNRWLVVRVGADIGLRCLGCGRRVLLSRAHFRKRLKRVVGRAPTGGDDAAPEGRGSDPDA